MELPKNRNLSNQFPTSVPDDGSALNAGPVNKPSNDNSMAHASAFHNASQRMSDDTNNYGGSSVHPTSLSFPEVGSASEPSRSKGFMVGGTNDHAGNRIAGSKPMDTFTPLQAGIHIMHTANQSQGESSTYAGSWKDDNGQVVTDASTRVRQHDRAARLGDERGEDAIFGLQKGNEVILKSGKAKAAAKKASQSA